MNSYQIIAMYPMWSMFDDGTGGTDGMVGLAGDGSIWYGTHHVSRHEHYITWKEANQVFEEGDQGMNVAGFTKSQKFCDTKTHTVLAEFHQLVSKNPKLMAVLLYCGFLAWVRFGKKILITSIFRTDNDPNKLHRNWQAADCRMRRPDDINTELDLEEWEWIAGMANSVFHYGKTWLGHKTNTVKIRRGGTVSEPVPHVHIQTKDTGTWR